VFPPGSTNHRFLKFSCWLPVYFVARLLGINKLPLFPSEMYEMIETGELPTIHIGRAVRVSSNAIGKWVEEHEQQED
jgi:predicted DNA-binding transcriptional regulator AlpA